MMLLDPLRFLPHCRQVSSRGDDYRSFRKWIDGQPVKMLHVMRHAGVGYDIAIDCAKKQGMNLPGIAM